jgi:ribonuclease HI
MVGLGASTVSEFDHTTWSRQAKTFGRNLSERCPGAQTNNRAEIYAIVRLLEEAPMNGRKSRLIIKTDSKYTINCVDWASRWELKGWMRSPGEKVKNAVSLYSTTSKSQSIS